MCDRCQRLPLGGLPAAEGVAFESTPSDAPNPFAAPPFTSEDQLARARAADFDAQYMGEFPPPAPLSLWRLQAEIAEWATRQNFKAREPMLCVAGATEETGELAEADPDAAAHVAALVTALGRLNRAELKRAQGIWERPKSEAKAKDAVGDVVVFLADYCNQRGFDLQAIIEAVWGEVSRRYNRSKDGRNG